MSSDHTADQPTPAGSATPNLMQLAHEYAVIFAEYRWRCNYRPYSVRQRFDGMSDEDVNRLLDEAKAAIAAASEPAGGEGSE